MALTPTNYDFNYPLPATARLAHGRGFLMHVKNIAQRGPRLIMGRRVFRSPQVSAAEYEDRWHRRLRQQTWEQYHNLEDYLASQKGVDQQILVVMEGKTYSVDIVDFFRWRLNKICRIFQTFYQPDQPITELGCGYGKNVLALWACGFRQLAGYDISASGLEMARLQAEHFGVKVQLGTLNLTNPADPAWSQLTNRVVFTHHVIEQLPRHVNTVVDRLLEVRPQEVLHMEPIVDFIQPYRSLTDLETWLHTRLSDYQTSLLDVLRSYESAKRLEILDVIPLRFAAQIRSCSTLIRWRPR